VDVSPTDWFYNDVAYAYANNLFAGIDATHFAPGGAMTRGMLVTVMNSYAGRPKPASGNPFSDVPDGAWYANPVIWAAENRIVSGIGGGLFAPDNNITREQFASILYRFAKEYQKRDVSKTAELTFADSGDISEYAREAVRWCVANKIISGRPGNIFDPQGNATRAEVAVMLHKFAGI
jgi:hypothetical protein